MDVIEVQILTDRNDYLPSLAVVVDHDMRVSFECDPGTVVYGYRVRLTPRTWSPPVLFPQPQTMDGDKAAFTVKGKVAP